MTLKDFLVIFVFLGQSDTCIFKSTQYVCQFTPLNFDIMSVDFRYLTGGKLTLRPKPGNFFENLTFFPVSRAVLTGLLRQGVQKKQHFYFISELLYLSKNIPTFVLYLIFIS